MPKSPSRKGPNLQISAGFSERFPSLQLWEASCESSLDLPSLRTQAGKLRQLSDLIRQSIQRCPELRAERGHLEINEDRLRELVAGLNLEPTSAEQLLEDATLIAAWYLLPQRRAALRFDTQQHVAAMQAVARQARRLHDKVFANLMGLEELLEALNDDGEAGLDDFDLRQYATTLSTFSFMAQRAADLTRPGHGGRKSEDRRNLALALLIMAIEQANGERVCTSRADEVWRFTTQAGQFVCNVFATLGWPDERVLVSVVRQISRARRKTIA